MTHDPRQMSSGLLFACVGALLFALGIAGVIVIGHLLRRVLAFNVMGSGVFLILVGLAQRNDVPEIGRASCLEIV